MKNFFQLVNLLLFVSACGSSSEAPTTDLGAPDGGGSPDGSVSACTAARAQLLGAVNSVTTGNVTVLGTTAGVTTLYVDASAGGVASASTNPWSFINLATGAKVAVTDTSSVTSTAWDLAFKRPIIYTNDGDGGPGQGSAALIQKSFDSVSAADATSATFKTEKFFDAQCNPILDQTGAVQTTFSAWYDYNPNTHVLTPAAGTWLVRGATGKLYKLAITTYYANPDGSVGTGGGGTYALKVGAL